MKLSEIILNSNEREKLVEIVESHQQPSDGLSDAELISFAQLLERTEDGVKPSLEELLDDGDYDALDAFDIRRDEYSPEQLDDMLRNGDIVKEDFQRKQGAWDSKTKTEFVLSIIEGIEILPVMLAKDYETGFVSIIDALQRITTLASFKRGEFSLGKGPRGIKNRSYRTMSPSARATIDKFYFNVWIYRVAESRRDIRYRLFVRYNRGKGLTTFEMRQFDYMGALLEMIRERVNREEAPYILDEDSATNFKSEIRLLKILAMQAYAAGAGDFDLSTPDQTYWAYLAENKNGGILSVPKCIEGLENFFLVLLEIGQDKLLRPNGKFSEHFMFVFAGAVFRTRAWQWIDGVHGKLLVAELHALWEDKRYKANVKEIPEAVHDFAAILRSYR